MCSFVLFSFYYIINFVLKVKAQTSITLKDLNDCYNNRTKYYNTIYKTCSDCRIEVFNNICYRTPKSVYGFPENFEMPAGGCSSTSNHFLTELDENGNYLGKLICASTKEDISQFYIELQEKDLTQAITLNYLDNIRARQQRILSKGFTLNDYDPNEIRYAYKACIEGAYEKSCQYFINLCVLSMYDENNIYCKKVKEFEDAHQSYG